MSILTEVFEGNTEDEDAAIVELVAAAIVSVTDGSDTMKNFVTHRKHKESQRKNSMKKQNKEEDRRAERENEIERKYLLD